MTILEDIANLIRVAENSPAPLSSPHITSPIGINTGSVSNRKKLKNKSMIISNNDIKRSNRATKPTTPKPPKIKSY